MPTPLNGLSTDPGIPGVYGENTQGGDGVFGSGRDDGRGVVGVSTQHTAVEGNTVNGIAVFGAASQDGTGRGVVGKTTRGTAVEGGSEEGVGVWGQSQKSSGVFGHRALCRFHFHRAVSPKLDTTRGSGGRRLGPKRSP